MGCGSLQLLGKALRKLVTLEDLQTQPPEVLAEFVKWAGELSGMYEKFLNEDDEDEEFTVSWYSSKGRAVGIHASEISGCQRRTVYTLLGTEKRGAPIAMWKRKFRAGHLYHQLLQRDFHRMCARTGGLVKFVDEIRINPKLQQLANDLGIHSSCDGAFTFHDDVDGPPILQVGLELKSASPNEWADLKKPKDEHVEQSTMYQKLLDIPLMWTLYYNKGTQALTKSEHPWLFRFNERVWADIEKRIGERHQDVVNGVLPNRLEGVGCEFCPYSWTCAPDYLKKKAAKEAAKKARSRTTRLARRIRYPGG